MLEYKTLIVQDISSFPGPHVTDIDGKSLMDENKADESAREFNNYVPLHTALNRFGRQGWMIDHVIQGVIDGAIVIMKREIQS